MKNLFAERFLLLIITALLVSPLSAQDLSLVGFWTFDDSTGVDSSSYGNNGILSGDPMIINGMKGSAIYFDGINDQVVINDENSLDTDSSMTIALWIMPDSVNSGGAKVMSKWYSAPEQGDWLLSLSSRDSCNGTCVSYYFGFANYSVYGTTNGWFSIGPHNLDYYLLLGEWNFIAVTFDTGFVNLYYNGELIYTDTTIIKYTSLNEYGTDDIYIGRYHTGNPNYSFKGGLDEIRIYNRPLSASEINDIYNQVTQVENNINNLPEEFALSQNYPNPFNPSTRIKYSITQTSKVIIRIFDILGNEIETLVNEEKPTGIYEIEWNATDLPSGVYFYNIKAVDPSTGSGQVFVETKKMVLLK
jgi:hypothetical protein